MLDEGEELFKVLVECRVYELFISRAELISHHGKVSWVYSVNASG